MGEDAIYLGSLYTKDQLAKMYADTKHKLEAVRIYLMSYFDEGECLVCRKPTDDGCQRYYDFAEKYFEEIKKVIEAAPEEKNLVDHILGRVAQNSEGCRKDMVEIKNLKSVFMDFLQWYCNKGVNCMYKTGENKKKDIMKFIERLKFPYAK